MICGGILASPHTHFKDFCAYSIPLQVNKCHTVVRIDFEAKFKRAWVFKWKDGILLYSAYFYDVNKKIDVSYCIDYLSLWYKSNKTLY